MATLVRIPKPSANVEQVTIMRWLVNEGESVEDNAPLVEASTEKNAIEIEAPATGVLRKVLAAEKSVLPTGYIIAVLANAEEEIPDVAEENGRLMARMTQTNQSEPARLDPPPRPRRARTRVRATPAARRLARELGLNLADVAANSDDDIVSESAVQTFADGAEDA